MLVAAVAMAPSSAELLMRRFRKRTGLAGEIKGHNLTPVQRAAFFKLMERHTPDALVAVISDHASPAGALARKQLKQYELWAELVAEAILALCDQSCPRNIIVTPDHGAARADVLDGLERISNAGSPLPQTRLSASNADTAINIQAFRSPISWPIASVMRGETRMKGSTQPS